MGSCHRTSLPYQCKYIHFITMLYIALMLLTSLIGFKIIITPLGEMSAASLYSPFWFLLGDVIAEVYGYRISMRIFLSALACEIIFATLGCLAIHLPSPQNWHHQVYYDLIIGSLPKIYFFQMIGMLLSWTFNIFFLTRWKFILQGKYFWFRSLATSGVAESLFSVISVSLTILGNIPKQNIVSVVLWSLSLKILFTILFAYPVNSIVHWLKDAENIDVYDNVSGINPFKVDDYEGKLTG